MTLTHAGGEPVVAGDVTVVLRQGGSASRSRLSTWTFERDDGDGRFEPSERATRSHGLVPGTVEVVVVHRPSESLLLDETLVVGAATTTETTTTTTTATPPPTTTTATPAPNQPPTASFTYSCAGVSCSFDAAGSDDPDGGIVDYAWTFGDGGTGSGRTASHAYGSRGTRTVTLTVTDDDGATDSVARQVHVVPYQPALTWVSVQDRTENDNAEYRVSYDVANTTELRNVTVEFDNRANDWSDATVASDSARGYVDYYEGGVGGDAFEVTVRVYNLSGAVTDNRTITDVADGDDPADDDPPTSPSGPSFAGTVVDDVSTYQADYEVSYNVTNRSEFGHVDVEIENLDSGGADATYASTDPRDNVEDYADASYGGTFGDSYRITLQVVDATGVVVDEVVVTDDADGTDPPGNADLSRPASPDLGSWSVEDLSTAGRGARFDVQYAATDDAAFGGVEVIFRNRDSPYASETALGPASGTISHEPGYGYGDSYEIAIRVVDADGIVVDEVLVTDDADGTDP